MSVFLGTTDHQFGFKHGLSAVSCVFCLKDVINYFRDLNYYVFTCFLDTKSAFDRVSFTRFFQTLLIVEFHLTLLFYYRNGILDNSCMLNGVILARLALI